MTITSDCAYDRRPIICPISFFSSLPYSSLLLSFLPFLLFRLFVAVVICEGSHAWKITDFVRTRMGSRRSEPREYQVNALSLSFALSFSLFLFLYFFVSLFLFLSLSSHLMSLFLFVLCYPLLIAYSVPVDFIPYLSSFLSPNPWTQ